MFWASLKAVALADLLDIALVAVLIYALLVWFKRAKAAIVAKGMLIVTAVYLLARVLGMHMTTSAPMRSFERSPRARTSISVVFEVGAGTFPPRRLIMAMRSKTLR
ncbi:hypothetical protein ACFL2T_06985, partial [Elusimicrobiota bacterium]